MTPRKLGMTQQWARKRWLQHNDGIAICQSPIGSVAQQTSAPLTEPLRLDPGVGLVRPAIR